MCDIRNVTCQPGAGTCAKCPTVKEENDYNQFIIPANVNPQVRSLVYPSADVFTMISNPIGSYKIDGFNNSGESEYYGLINFYNYIPTGQSGTSNVSIVIKSDQIEKMYYSSGDWTNFQKLKTLKAKTDRGGIYITLPFKSTGYTNENIITLFYRDPDSKIVPPFNFTVEDARSKIISTDPVNGNLQPLCYDPNKYQYFSPDQSGSGIQVNPCEGSVEPSPTPSPNPVPTPMKLNAGEIAGIVIGCVAGVALIVGLSVGLTRKK